MLDRSEKKWPEVLWNYRKALRVWIRLWKLLQREGDKPQVSVMFYHAVVQTVLLFGVKTWVLSEAMYRKLEGSHVGLLKQITGQREAQQKDRTWRCVVANSVLKK